MQRSRLVLVIGALAVILVTPGAALAEAPANDLITSATPITTLPFAVEQDTTEANGDGPRSARTTGPPSTRSGRRPTRVSRSTRSGASTTRSSPC